MNIVMDTNILVSALYSPNGKAAKVIEAILENRFTVCYDRQIAEEYNKVLRYPKLKFKEDDIVAFIEPVLDYGLGIINYPKTDAVFDQDEKLVEQWISKAGEAHKIRNLLVGETYILREESAPYGYLRTTDVEFTVKDTKTIQSVVMKDDVPTGTIIISKTGELLYDRNEKRWMKTDFDWRESSLAGVTFTVYAAEDIVSPEDMGIQYYAKDELVAEIQTEEDGTASIEGLPLGRYYLKEIDNSANKNIKIAKITAAFQVEPDDARFPDGKGTIEVTDEPVTGALQISKLVRDSDGNDKGSLYSAEGTKFELFSEPSGGTKLAELIIGSRSSDGAYYSNTVKGIAFGTYYLQEVSIPKSLQDAGASLVSTRVKCEIIPEKLNTSGVLISEITNTVVNPSIETSAADVRTGSQSSLCGSSVTITDHVSYEKLVPQREYVITGTLMDREKKEPLKVAPT